MDSLLADQLKALAHPARLEILRVLARRGRCVCGEVVEVMPLAQATVSQHLKILKEAGLVRGEIDGRKLLLLPRPAGHRRAARGARRLLGELSAALPGRHPEPEEADDMRTDGRDQDAGARALRRHRAASGPSCCAPASCGCGPEMAPDGLNVIGDAYAGRGGPARGGRPQPRLRRARPGTRRCGPARPCSTSAPAPATMSSSRATRSGRGPRDRRRHDARDDRARRARNAASSASPTSSSGWARSSICRSRRAASTS